MNKHTPGPWELAEKFNCVEVRAVDGPYIANCNQSAAIDWRIKEANARLIAAAPDLLEALADLLDVYRRGAQGFPLTYEFCKVIEEQAANAIAKATGEA